MSVSNQFSATDETQKKGGAPVGGRPENIDMLSVAEKPIQGKLEASPFVGQSEDHRAWDWLEFEIKRSRRGVTSQVVELTPALARVLLARNSNNRHISDAIVEQYTRDIEHGLWQFNGEALIVSDEGHLNDGQHRCSAVVQANKSIQIVLVIGTPHASRMTTDQGKTKTVADFLAMQGHVDTARLGAAAGFIWQHLTRGQIWTSGKPTKAECMLLVGEHPDIVDSVAFVQIKGADAYGGRSMLAFCHWTFWHASRFKRRDEADYFIKALVKGNDLLTKDPILYCRNRMITERGRLRTNDRAELLFRTWNAYRRNETPKTLPILGGALPVVAEN